MNRETMRNRSRLLYLIVAGAVLVLGTVLLQGYVTDDTFIHLRYAENLIERGEFSFNPGHDTYGATSPLWIFGLALLMQAGLAPLTAAWVLGFLSALLALAVLAAIVDRLTFPTRWKLAIMVLAAADAWFLRWSGSGMETPLATALLLVLLWPLVSGRDLGWGIRREPLWQRYLAWGVAAGLAGLVRPEFLLVAPTALPWLLWFEYMRAGAVEGLGGRHRARPHHPLLAAGVGWLTVTGPWFVFAWVTFGRIVPGTAAAKSRALNLVPAEVLANLWGSLKHLAATQLPLWVAIILLMLVVIWRPGLKSAGRSDPGEDPGEDPLTDSSSLPGMGAWSVWGPVAMFGIAVTWTAMLLGGYALKQVWTISRYVSPLAPVHLLALAVVAEWLLAAEALPRLGRRVGQRILLGAVIATVLWNGWLLTARVLPHARQFPQDLQECYLGIGDWLRQNTPEDTVIAALDIGALGYASDRQILDLMGLVSPEILELGRRLGFQEMVATGAWLPDSGEVAMTSPPRYLVDRSEGAPRWVGRQIKGIKFTLLDTCLIRGVGLREAQPWTIALYRLDPSGEETETSDSAGL